MGREKKIIKFIILPVLLSSSVFISRYLFPIENFYVNQRPGFYFFFDKLGFTLGLVIFCVIFFLICFALGRIKPVNERVFLFIAGIGALSNGIEYLIFKNVLDYIPIYKIATVNLADFMIYTGVFGLLFYCLRVIFSK